MRDAEMDRDALRQRLAANLRAAREHAGLTQDAVADRMRDEYFPFSQQTLFRVEAASRKVVGEELMALARIYRVTMDELTRPGGLAREGWSILDAARRVREAHRGLSAVRKQFGYARDDLKQLIAAAEDAGTAKELAVEMASGRRALADTEEL